MGSFPVIPGPLQTHVCQLFLPPWNSPRSLSPFLCPRLHTLHLCSQGPRGGLSGSALAEGPLHGHFPVGGLGWLHIFHFHQHGMISDSHTPDLGGRSVMWVGSWVGISF